MVTVRITETYDLSTKIDSLGVIGIHTPSAGQIERVWGSLFKCHSHYKIKSMDCVMACASMLPADPSQIGTEAGDIAPQDLFNPILYTAVSNEGFNRIINRIYNGSHVGVAGTMSVVKNDVEGSGTYSAFDVYYGLLSESDRYAKAMPQAGLQMRGLVPIVYPLLGNYGNGYTANSDGTIASALSNAMLNKVPGDAGQGVSALTYFRGRPQPMPAIPTTAMYAQSSGTSGVSVEPSYPQTYVACIIVPPGKLHKLYYRLSISWYIEFSGLRSDLEVASIGTTGLAGVGQKFYATDYEEQSKNFEKTTDSVDVSGVSVEPIMLSGH